MQIIVDVPNSLYANLSKITNGSIATKRILDCVKYGTPLPKGHGNIYDEKDIKKEIKNPYQCQTVLYGLELVKPIIEADTESEEQA